MPEGLAPSGVSPALASLLLDSLPAMSRIPAPITLKGKALQLLAARDYTRAEMERKLTQWLRERSAREEETEAAPLDAEMQQVDQASAIAEALDAMEAKGFLDDQRAAEALIHRRAGKLGNSRIQQELRQKGLDASAIEQAMEAVPGSELERAREIWQRKFGSVAASQQERLKQMRFLASRGFSSAVVHQVVRGSPDE